MLVLLWGTHVNMCMPNEIYTSILKRLGILAMCSMTQKVKLSYVISKLTLTPQKIAVLAAPDPNLKVLLHSHSKLTLVSLSEAQETGRTTIELRGT